MRPVFRFALLLFGVMVLAALFADLGGLQRKAREQRAAAADGLLDIVLAPGGARYADPGGLFSIVPPSGWKADRSAEARPYSVVLRGPPGVDISIMATRVKYNTLPELMADIRRSEVAAGIGTMPQPFFLHGRPVLKRIATLHHSKVFAVDFVEDHVAHHISCAMPIELFDRYEPVLMEVVGTYRPSGGAPSETR